MNKIVTVIFLITDQQVIALWKKISRPQLESYWVYYEFLHQHS